MGVKINADAIKQRCKTLDMPRKELAKKAKVTRRQISRILKEQNTTVERLQLLAKALKLDPSELQVDDSPEPSANPAKGQDKGNSYSRSFNLLAPLADFVDREEEFDYLTSAIKDVGGKHFLVDLRGMGGSGKTCLAVKVAHAVKDLFPDAYLYFNLDGMSHTPRPAEAVMCQIIQALDPAKGILTTDTTTLTGIYRSTLNKQRALILLDNVKNDAHVEPLIAGDQSTFIITGRTAITLDGTQSCIVNLLPEQAAKSLLRGVIGRRGTDDELKEIAHLCGYLPSALRAAGKFLKQRRSWTVPKYITRLKQERQGSLKIGLPTDDVGYVLELSSKQFAKEHPDHALRWHSLATWPADFTPETVAFVWDMSLDEAEECLSIFDDHSLILYDPEAHRFRLHDLFKPIATRLPELDEMKSFKYTVSDLIHRQHVRTARYFVNILANCQELYLKGAAALDQCLTLLDVEFINVRYWQSWAMQRFNADANDLTSAKLCRDFALEGTLPIALRLPFDDRIRWLESSISACVRLEDERCEAHSHVQLGHAWSALAEYRRAIVSHERGRILAKKIGNESLLGKAIDGIGNAWTPLGNTKEAIKCHTTSLAIAEKLNDLRGRGRALGCIGNAYLEVGDYSQAIFSLTQGLALSRAVGDRRAEQHALRGLGSATIKQGNPSGGKTTYQETLEIATETRDRRGEGRSITGIGDAWSDLRDYHQASELHQRGIEIALETQDRRAEAHARYRLAEDCRALRKKEEAIMQADKAFALFEAMESPFAKEVQKSLKRWRGKAG